MYNNYSTYQNCIESLPFCNISNFHHGQFETNCLQMPWQWQVNTDPVLLDPCPILNNISLVFINLVGKKAEQKFMMPCQKVGIMSKHRGLVFCIRSILIDCMVFNAVFKIISVISWQTLY